MHLININPKDWPNEKDRNELLAKTKEGKPDYERSKHIPPSYASDKYVDVYIDHVKHFDATGGKRKWTGMPRGEALIATPHRVIVGPPDEVWRDYDPRALKWYLPDREPSGSQSDLVGQFVAKLATRVNEQWPGRRVTYLAHNNYSAAPTDRVKFPQNVDVLATVARHSTPLYGQKVYTQHRDKEIDDWYEKLGRNRNRIALWDYPNRPGRWVLFPCYYPFSLQRFLQQVKNKIAGENVSAGPAERFELPIRSLWMALLWNPDIDVKAWLLEFCQKMFGPASQEMYEIILIASERYENYQWAKKMSEVGGTDTRPRNWHAVFPPEVVAKLKVLFTKALSLAEKDKNSLYLQRLQFMYNKEGEYYAWAWK